MAGINHQSKMALKYADKQGSASYGGIKQDAAAEAVYNAAEAIHSLQTGCGIERIGRSSSYELVLS